MPKMLTHKKNPTNRNYSSNAVFLVYVSFTASAKYGALSNSSKGRLPWQMGIGDPQFYMQNRLT